MPAKTLSSRSIGMLAFGVTVLALFLLSFPYYYSPQSYIPKNNPDLGYYMPNTLEAWIALAAALALLMLGVILIYFYGKKRVKEGKGVNRPFPSLHKIRN